MNTNNICFWLRNKKNINTFGLKKKIILSRAMIKLITSGILGLWVSDYHFLHFAGRPTYS